MLNLIEKFCDMYKIGVEYAQLHIFFIGSFFSTIRRYSLYFQISYNTDHRSLIMSAKPIHAPAKIGSVQQIVIMLQPK